MNNAFQKLIVDMGHKCKLLQKTSISTQQNTGRNYNLDLIRSVAIILLISFHFFWKSDFYHVIITGYKCFFMIILRTVSVTCVPLFLLLTGYLMSAKKTEFSFNYYCGIFRVLGVYIISRIPILIFANRYLNQNINFLWSIVSFEQYSWYVEMYIGLFLIIPFLNIIWENLKSEKQKKYLLFSLLFLTAFPSIFLYNGVTYWISIYPVTYYFLGAYLAGKEALIIKKRKEFLILLVVCILFFSSLYFITNYNQFFIWYGWREWGSLHNTINAVLIFSLLQSIPHNLFFKSAFQRVIYKIASLSYGMYLTSWIMDQIVYDKLKAFIQLQDRAYYYLPCVIIVFMGSFCLSYVLDKFYNIILKTVSFLHQ